MRDSMDGFAPDFAEALTAHWNHGPRVFRNALLSPMLTDRDFMTVVRSAAKEYIADPSARIPPGRMFLNHEAVTPDRLPPLLPRDSEETCEQYVNRIVRTHPQEALGIVIDNCEKQITDWRDRLLPTLHYLFSRVGYPARRNHLCLYGGTYRSTPFGIHRDDCHVVMFSARRKSMAFWPRGYFEEKKQLFVNGKLRARLEDHVAKATVLEIGPLDALYWSAADYHVALSDTDEFHAALSVGIYHHGSSAEVMTSLDFLAAATRVDGLDIPGLPGASEGKLAAEDLSAAPMAEFFARWEQLRDMLNRPGEVQYRALGLALRLISSAGYGKPRTPPPSAPPHLAGLMLRCAVPESLVVARARGGLLVGANGSAFFYERAEDAIEDAVLKLRGVISQRFDDVIDAVDAASGEAVTSAICDLINAGALSAEPQPERD